MSVTDAVDKNDHPCHHFSTECKSAEITIIVNVSNINVSNIKKSEFYLNIKHHKKHHKNCVFIIEKSLKI